MENKPIMQNEKKIIPAPGIQRIVKGVRYEAEDPQTHEKIWVGDGEVMYDISNSKRNPFFALKLLTNEE